MGFDGYNDLVNQVLMLKNGYQPFIDRESTIINLVHEPGNPSFPTIFEPFINHELTIINQLIDSH